MLIGQGSPGQCLTDEAVHEILDEALAALPLTGKRLLVLLPDATRTAPIPLLFRLLHRLLAGRVARLDYLIALGTHPPMETAAIERLVGKDAPGRDGGRTSIFNHAWDDPGALATLGVIGEDEMARLTGGLLAVATEVRINRRIFDYDQLLICGPVFPHEVVGFSGGAKYLFPGIAGREIIDTTHWLGALSTSMSTIGVKDTIVRRVIHHAAEFVPVPVLCAALVLRRADLHGLYVGPHAQAWSAAADLSKELNIVHTTRRYKRVLSLPSTKYADLWTAAKAMYKTEPVVEDGGEVVIYAPHLAEVSFTHGTLIDRVGYHVRDYFLAQWDRFRTIPLSILAHSTHVKGAGSYDAEQGERPRIQVTLATGIPEERCRRIHLGFADPRHIDPAAWEGREEEGFLLVRNAGEVLYRLRGA
ncbi:lactate racemase domain-containing protein [Polyangium sorediatum]|uniref:Lactate racemase domain-containing protein n=1 Tax=Polyangium sorediatum TaxID=889274 RepID=A0ABT6PA07_9BACT|nr:lactate racemase domain-containing protein [Polyangium sorediatum]MDI1436955.1 lactate racemase domain-containing protein [Polyangium sorediatum]